MLNDMFHLGLTEQQLIERATRLGADCPFFVTGKPAYAEGIGERLQHISVSLEGWLLAIVKPPVAVSTRDAFMRIVPHAPQVNCRQVVEQEPIERWPELLENDFEQSVFALYPQLATIKERLYQHGAAYASMSGSGSALFGLFRDNDAGLGKSQGAPMPSERERLQKSLHSAMPADCQLFIVSAES
jgi:4-diphosphocytidyl-2-C-methyl-D-erythritol kinase